MSNPYIDHKTSLLSYCKNFLSRNTITGFDVFDFDAHAATNELPDKDLIGISDYGIVNNKDMYIVHCAIVVCTKSDDSNLTRLTNVINKLFNELRPGETGDRFALITSSGTPKGFMTVMDPVEALPVGQTRTRPIQAMAVSFGSGYYDRS